MSLVWIFMLSLLFWTSFQFIIMVVIYLIIKKRIFKVDYEFRFGDSIVPSIVWVNDKNKFLEEIVPFTSPPEELLNLSSVKSYRSTTSSSVNRNLSRFFSKPDFLVYWNPVKRSYGVRKCSVHDVESNKDLVESYYKSNYNSIQSVEYPKYKINYAIGVTYNSKGEAFVRECYSYTIANRKQLMEHRTPFDIESDYVYGKL